MGDGTEAAVGQRQGAPAALRERLPGDRQYALFRAVLTAKDIVPRIAWLMGEEPSVAARTAWYLDCKEAVHALHIRQQIGGKIQIA